MLSCYTPFLLAIAKCRVAESADCAFEDPTEAPPGVHKIQSDHESVGPREPGANVSGAVDHARCPSSLCAEALWAMSEYAVLSPGLAAEKVLPLAETLARDTAEDPQVHKIIYYGVLIT